MPNDITTTNSSKRRILIFLGVLFIVLFVIAIFYLLSRPETQDNGDTNRKTSTISAKPSTASTKVNKYVDWKSFSNPEAGFSLKYPKNWVSLGYPDSDLCNVDHTFLAPNEDFLGVCASGVGGMISITRTPTGANLESVFPNYSDHNFANRTDKDVMLDGKVAKKITGVSNLVSEIDNFTGHTFIIYLVDFGDRTLIIQYNQAPNKGDFSKEFEEIVSTLDFN